jgi:hypothetical protein
VTDRFNDGRTFYFRVGERDVIHRRLNFQPYIFSIITIHPVTCT